MHNKLQSIQALRGIAVILVTCFHIMSSQRKYDFESALLPHFLSIGFIGVDIFFIISGFILTVITKDYFGNRSKFFKFAYFRFTRIYPLYWLYTLLLLPVLFFKPDLITLEVDLISSFLLLPSDKMPLVLVGWTLVYEVYFYVIFSFFILFGTHDKLHRYAFLWFLFISIGSVVFDQNSILLHFITNPWGIEFIFGMIIGKYYLTSDTKTPFGIFGIILALIGFIFIVYYDEGVFLNIEGWLRIPTYGLAALLLVVSTIQLEKQGFIFNKFLLYIGDASYSIYLSHLFIINVIGKVFSIFSQHTFFSEFITVVTMFAASFIIGFLSYRFLETPMINFTKNFYDKRFS